MRLKNIILGAVTAVAVAISAAGCSSKSEPGNVGEVTLNDGDLVASIEIEGYGTITAKLFPDVAPNAVKNFRMLADQGYYDGLRIHRVTDDLVQGGSLNGDGTGGCAALDGMADFPIETSQDARNFYGALCYANTNGRNATQFYIVSNNKPADISQYDPAKIRAKADEFAKKKDELTSAAEEGEKVDTDYYTAMENYYKNLADMMEKASDKVKAKYKEVGGYPLWDGGYTVFGQVVEGFDVIKAISAVERTADNAGGNTRPASDIIIRKVTVYEYVGESGSSGSSSSGSSSSGSSSGSSSAADSSAGDSSSGGSKPESSGSDESAQSSDGSSEEESGASDSEADSGSSE